MLRSNAADLYLADALPALDDLIYDEYDIQPDFVSKIFNLKTGKGWGAQTSTFAGLGLVPTASEGAGTATDEPIQGYDKTYTFVTYKLKTFFSKEYVEDEKWDEIAKTYRSLGRSMSTTIQIVGHNVLNNGFSDTGPDGVSLFNTAHPLEGGGTYRNRPTSAIALSIAGLRDMDVSMMNMVDGRGLNIVLMPKTLVVPPDLKFLAHELIKSAYKPATANNDINTFESAYEIIVTPFLTSTTAWFGLADKGQHELRYYNRVSPYTQTWVDDDTDDVYTKIRCRFDVGYSDGRGTYGSAGA